LIRDRYKKRKGCAEISSCRVWADSNRDQDSTEGGRKPIARKGGNRRQALVPAFAGGVDGKRVRSKSAIDLDILVRARGLPRRVGGQECFTKRKYRSTFQRSGKGKGWVTMFVAAVGKRMQGQESSFQSRRKTKEKGRIVKLEANGCLPTRGPGVLKKKGYGFMISKIAEVCLATEDR